MDAEFERAIALSMEGREARGGVQQQHGAPAGEFHAPSFHPPPALPQFRAASAPIPEHLRATGNILDTDDYGDADQALEAALKASLDTSQPAMDDEVILHLSLSYIHVLQVSL